MNLWQVREENFDPKLINTQETIYSIGNGYFGTRGVFEEGFPESRVATLLYGVFDSVPIGKEELANVPDWTPIRLFVNGERFRLDRGKLLDYQRVLDMTTATLTRTLRWESPNGLRLKLETERFASLDNEHAGVIKYNLTIEEAPTSSECDVMLMASINTAVGNENLMHWETADQGHEGKISWLSSVTHKTQVELVQSMSFTTPSTAFQTELFSSDNAPAIRLQGKLKVGETLTTEKLVLMYTSRDGDNPRGRALQQHKDLLSGGEQTMPYDALHKSHVAKWAEYWEVADVIIEGDEKAQWGTRFSVYQLRISSTPNDSRYSIAAKGLTGFGYKGHIFHDTEIFMLPFFIYVFPEIARNLLLYRYNLLAGAREKAQQGGFEGAQYPWESTLDGREATPDVIIHPESHELIPVLNGHIELHITSSVAHAFADYWRVTGDDQFMVDYGAEVLLSTATFWGSRAEFHQESNDYQIRDVIGPDEYHEHVNNNAFTNYMARLNLQTALNILDWLKKNNAAKAQELIKQLNLNDQRLDHWRDVIARMHIPQNPDTKLFEQFDSFFKLGRLDREKYEPRTESYQGILGMKAIQDLQIVKQADVLMLLTVIKEQFDRQTKQVNWDYYYPITDHDYGSSLTPALHAILGSELGLTDVAYSLFMKGALVDLENLRGNTPEGIHDACAGAVWQAVVFGFAGLTVHDDGYVTKPAWPKNWTRIKFNFSYQGQRQHIDLRRDQ
ncbi:MAG TPA: glycosyl hydrolase family 65 protein [Ktedonobacteraceae bacterium]|nr:glycosyl hydrolase family 65 protein [Ktedonobacteraceae bacterium]